jgi:hypothetical protein
MTFKREIREGTQPQGEVEEITYFLDTRPWGGTPTNVSVAAFSYVTSGETTTYTDVTTTVFPVNSPSVSNNIITLSPLKSLTADTNYRIEIKFTSNAQVQEAYAYIDGER